MKTLPPALMFEPTLVGWHRQSYKLSTCIAHCAFVTLWLPAHSMGSTLSRIFHRKQDDEAKPKVKKPRRFGSLRRQRTDDQETGTRVSRSSTMPSRTQRVRTEDRSTGLIGETAEEVQRLEDRQEIMRDVMDYDETVTPVAAQHLSAQMPHVEPSHVPEHKEVVPEIKAELPGGFAAVQLVSVTSNDKAVEDVPELSPMTEALHEEEDEPVILNAEDLRQEHEEHTEHIEQKVSREQNIEPIMELEIDTGTRGAY
ncbi:hypothetical protein T265_01877 [Opisthorchis viverrini]|uniref:Uncharacterized protein n=1 Tax=Opisthorchis viverrini TaxID=6198 RepID=A0A075A104_OPIVI|nr:hypothetical protein T265_01877 [Opisthorchis viverrini]KER31942.1 hypothetical protein T265_01877 [Opisthorchis viverrini]